MKKENYLGDVVHFLSGNLWIFANTVIRNKSISKILYLGFIFGGYVCQEECKFSKYVSLKYCKKLLVMIRDQ